MNSQTTRLLKNSSMEDGDVLKENIQRYWFIESFLIYKMFLGLAGFFL